MFRNLEYRLKRLKRWTERFLEEYRPQTVLEQTVLNGLSIMSKSDEECWIRCFNKDAFEVILFVFMSGISPYSKREGDQRYYYGRIQINTITILGSSKQLKRILKNEINLILPEIFNLIKREVDQGIIRPFLWPIAYGTLG